VPEVPTAEILAAIPRGLLVGLITKYGEQARSAPFEHPWQKDAATWKAIQRALTAAVTGETAAVAAIPRWLEPLVRKSLKNMATRSGWASLMGSVRLLERTGLVTLEADDDYVLAVVGGLGHRQPGGRLAAFTEDVELRNRVVWRMFHVEGGGEVSLANADKYGGPEGTWSAVFLSLVADGTLPRERAIRECLVALGRDFSAYRAGWYAALLVSLNPGISEIAVEQPLVRALLRSQVTATVSLAVRLLSQLQKAGLLEGQDTVPALTAGVLCRVKGTSVAAVRLLGSLSHLPGVAEVATAALEHPHADVQRAAASLLDALGAEETVNAAALQPSVRRRAPATPLPTPVPLPPEQPLRAATEEDLVERMAALLEDASDPIEVELVLAAAVARTREDAFRPLLKRAHTIRDHGPREGVTAAWLRGQLARFVLKSCGDRVPPPISHSPIVDFLIRRIDDCGTRSAPLLATPERRAGWISPAALVDRLKQAQLPPARRDLVAALLRVTVDGRDEQLAGWREGGQLIGETAAVVRHAFGAPPPAATRRGLRKTSPVTTPSLWVAASRSRNPAVTDTWLVEQGITGAGRSNPLAARPDFTSHTTSWTDRSGAHQHTYARWSVDVPGLATQPRLDEPTAPTEKMPADLHAGLEDFVGWTAIVWPHTAEHFLVDGAESVFQVARGGEVCHDASRVLSALGSHEGQLGTMAHVTIAAGLAAEKVPERIVAVDAVLGLLARGSLTDEGLVGGLTDALPLITLTRWANSFTDLAAADTRANSLVINSLARALPTIDPRARGLHALLELLLEELIRTGRPTPVGLTDWLSTFGGNSRTAKVAQALATR